MSHTLTEGKEHLCGHVKTLVCVTARECRRMCLCVSHVYLCHMTSCHGTFLTSSSSMLTNQLHYHIHFIFTVKTKVCAFKFVTYLLFCPFSFILERITKARIVQAWWCRRGGLAWVCTHTMQWPIYCVSSITFLESDVLTVCSAFINYAMTCYHGDCLLCLHEISLVCSCMGLCRAVIRSDRGTLACSHVTHINTFICTLLQSHTPKF